MKKLFWGCGRSFFEFIKSHSYLPHEISAVCDSSPAVQDLKNVYCIPIIPPLFLKNADFDEVVITPKSEKIRMQIRSLLDDLKITKPVSYLSPNVNLRTLDDYDFYRLNLTDEEKKNLFKNHVDAVVLEANSRCNRKCWWCSNSLPNNKERNDENIGMPIETYRHALYELSEIDYQGVVALFNINEPLLCEDLCERIALCKKILPKSFVIITTNGDFLTREKFNELAHSGLDALNISVYVDMQESSEFTVPKAQKAIMNIIEKIGCVTVAEYVEPDNVEIYAQRYGEKTVVNAFCKNHRTWKQMFSRGGVLDTSRWNAKERYFPCLRAFHTFVANYNGNVYPCCMLTDRKEHDAFIAGNIMSESIFDIFASSKMRNIRRRLLFDYNDKICGRCPV